MILLDTHVLVWYFDGNAQLGPLARERVDAALRENVASVSAISFWEISMLVAKGRLVLRLPVEKWCRSVLKMRGVVPVPVEPGVALDAGRLPALHGDPADRIIIAAARANGCSLLTGDRKILHYGAEGHVRAIDASQ